MLRSGKPEQPTLAGILRPQGFGVNKNVDRAAAFAERGLRVDRGKEKAGVYAEHRWLKIKNSNYSQSEGRREMFEADGALVEAQTTATSYATPNPITAA
jgi:hypothetical protein